MVSGSVSGRKGGRLASAAKFGTAMATLRRRADRQKTGFMSGVD
jgi:hypothetical protein